MISNGKVKAYSGQGNFVGNFVAFLFVFFMLVGSIVALYFWDLDQVWLPGMIFIVLYCGSFLVAKEVIGRSDSLEQQDLHGEHGEPLDAMASRASSSRESAAEPHVR
ncbi:hypothetical protein LTH96_12005 [Nesterenkonia sp. LB17]|uniref:hypothetical protein n=1 Tax=unclassified Nesterenkonia TaxID=2629769 RepID=UPI001F4C8127|nr:MULTISPECIES: hypothetical protein [unclassified Nesterenkonia]MCH8561399.1 hypothetical protein [Nesterenkonia sp. DZ6]MCH8563844.1 hypothetical protein [Nesterenkonia sp. YGD6]MCH8566438.1 hypothetical protein [Nesterenkonia sp. LB17]MCH8571995.1 hypothetical protein [Nesterenkonia sp. AY15]